MFALVLKSHVTLENLEILDTNEQFAAVVRVPITSWFGLKH